MPYLKTREARQRRMVGVAIGAQTTGQALEALHEAAAVADIAELRLDLMVEFDLPRLLADRPCPVVVTCRPEREGGRYSGSEVERIAVLRQAIELGSEYVDVEEDAIGQLGERRGTRVIVSHHDFKRMPEDFTERWHALAATGADVVKLVGAGHDVRDILPVLRTLAQADRPTIAIAMGTAGLPTRLLALRYDACLLTYCALSGGGPTAPGQITVAELDEVYHGREIGPDTTVYGLIGPRVETDQARAYNGRFRSRGINAVAVPFVVPTDGDAADAIAVLHNLDLRGYHVHPPHQETVGQALDGLDPSACRAGKVNAIVRRGDALIGTWVQTPAEQLDLWIEAGERADLT